MCIIAGYAGNKPAAPILIEMLKKAEYIDGGLSTGIATIHEGKLYMRKVLGDVDTLLRETDALSLPGATGIIHSRTGNNYLSHAHPQLSSDGKLATVDNGTMNPVFCEEFAALSNRIMDEFKAKGIEIKSEVDEPLGYKVLSNGHGYHETELWPLYIGERVKKSTAEALRDGVAEATREILSILPADIIIASVHALVPDTITLGTVTRPMSVGIGDGECFMCTAALALPEYVQKRPVVFIPPTTVARVTPSGVNILSTSIEGTNVEQIDFRTARLVREDMEKRLKVGEENAISIYDLPFYTEWNEFWHKPLIDCKFKNDNTTFPLKPFASLIYEGLWSFHKEGRLRYKVGSITKADGTEKKIVKFWLSE